MTKVLWEITKQKTLHPSFQGHPHADFSKHISGLLPVVYACVLILLPWSYLECFHIYSSTLSSFQSFFHLMSPLEISFFLKARVNLFSGRVLCLPKLLFHAIPLLCTSKALCFSDGSYHRLHCISLFLWFILFICFVGITYRFHCTQWRHIYHKHCRSGKMNDFGCNLN